MSASEVDAPATGSPTTLRRRTPEYDDGGFRTDLERIRFSPYFSRLSAVTQVIPQAGSGTTIHNRLTHSLKVTAVARSIALGLTALPTESAGVLAELGGCDPVVAQAAACAHDLGHPPFGHLGEQILDSLARNRLGLTDGFEGNAQTFRILTTLDTSTAAEHGLNLTTAVRAAVLKYPWTRNEWIRGDAQTADDALDRVGGVGGVGGAGGAGGRDGGVLDVSGVSEVSGTPGAAAALDAGGGHPLPRGVGTDGSGANKYSAYCLDAIELAEVRAAYPRIGRYQQSIECSVMDIADDIAYAVHDLDDFYRAGVLQYTRVAAEFDAWLSGSASLAANARGELESSPRTPGYSLELAWRRALEKDAWIADEGAFRDAVRRVQDGLVDGLLSVPYDGGIASDRAIAVFTAYWIDRLKSSVILEPHPSVRSGHVRLTREAWHDVVVLKFVHARFVLDRPDLAIYQRGQARVLESLVDGFSRWMVDPDDAPRAPRRLTEGVGATTEAFFELRRRAPECIHGRSDDATLIEIGRGRAVIDYIASFTDAQAMSAAALITGTSDRLWEGGRSL